eukprot:CAMPEP_0168504164 /NCGR_PEP_ID=MMETSP0228-20121227/76228_1 /TAXON_ID=133427 /ORGANISM="Protoceratium reticulatum, Strain CCCM 535 (=CCMP 1889)" /LENGTH=76 /DNA_ID=CAMNT_0008521239 /DNA_START=20 /DNA_END=247 /DNA_ORIENTATION=+
MWTQTQMQRTLLRSDSRAYQCAPMVNSLPPGGFPDMSKTASWLQVGPEAWQFQVAPPAVAQQGNAGPSPAAISMMN